MHGFWAATTDAQDEQGRVKKNAESGGPNRKAWLSGIWRDYGPSVSLFRGKREGVFRWTSRKKLRSSVAGARAEGEARCLRTGSVRAGRANEPRYKSGCSSAAVPFYVWAEFKSRNPGYGSRANCPGGEERASGSLLRGGGLFKAASRELARVVSSEE